MSGLPERFPRAKLVAYAATIESEIQKQLDITHSRIQEAEDRGMGLVTIKFATRFNTLDDARKVANELRQILWDLK